MNKKNLIWLLVLLQVLYPLSGFARTVHYVCDSATAASTTPPQAGGKTGADWANCWDYVDVFPSDSAKKCSSSAYPKPTSSPDCTNLIGAGDTVYIDGGSETPGIVYTGAPSVYGWRVQNSGASRTNPITFAIDNTDSTHNYKATIDTNFSGGASQTGFFLTGNYITINGYSTAQSASGYRGIVIQDTNGPGVEADGVKGITLKYLEVTNTGKGNTNTYANIVFASNCAPDSTDYNEVSYCLLHDQYYDVGYESRQKNIKISSSTTPAAEYGTYKIHHNTFRNAMGDHIESAQSGVDMYSNTFGNDAGVEFYDTFHGFGAWYRAWDNILTGYETSNSEHFYFEFHNENTSGGHNGYGHIVVYNNLAYPPMNGVFVMFGHHLGHDVNSETSLNDVYILNNTVDGTQGFITNVFGTGLTYTNVSDVVFANNIIENQTSYTFNFATGANGVPVGDGTLTWGGYGSGANIIVDNNIAYAATGTTGTTWGTSHTWAEFKAEGHCYAGSTACNANDQGSPTDPHLTDYAPTDGSSHAVNTGLNYSAVTDLSVNGGPCAVECKDLAGIARPQGATWDIGAYEFPAGGGTDYTISPSIASGSGTLSPDVDQLVANGGDGPTFTGTPHAGFKNKWSGSCGATGSASTYQKTGVTESCTVIIDFIPVMSVIGGSVSGGSVN